MKRYEELYHKILQSKDDVKMEMLGGVFLSMMAPMHSTSSILRT